LKLLALLLPRLSLLLAMLLLAGVCRCGSLAFRHVSIPE
jgi:hypothetical protein